MTTEQKEVTFEEEFARRAAEREGASSESAASSVDTPTTKPSDEGKAAEGAAAAGGEKPAEKPAAAEKPAEKKPEAPAEPAWIAALPKEHQDTARADWKARVEAERVANEKVARMGGQVNAYQRRHDTLLQENKALKAKPAETKPAESGKAAETADGFNMEEFKTRFPEIAQAIEARVQDVRAKVEAVKAEIDPLAQDRDQQIRDAGAAAIEAAHPGWVGTAKTPEFKEWFSKQAASLRSLASSENPEDTILVLDFFKATHPSETTSTDNAQTQEAEAAGKVAADKAAADVAAKRKKQLDDAVGVPSGRPRSEATASAPDDYAAAFAFYAAEREKKARMAQQA